MTDHEPSEWEWDLNDAVFLLERAYAELPAGQTKERVGFFIQEYWDGVSRAQRTNLKPNK